MGAVIIVAGSQRCIRSEYADLSGRPEWLGHGELTAANENYQRSGNRAALRSDEQLEQAARRLLREEIAFISNPSFLKPGASALIFGSELALAPAGLSQRSSGGDLPSAIARLCEAELLTPDQERLLFQRMNFLRHQAVLHRCRLSAENPNRMQVELVERLLALADWHRDRILHANLRLVISIVKKFVNQSNSFDDLLSDGVMALLRAVDKFDFDRGFRFSTYATKVVNRNAYHAVMQKQQDRSRLLDGLQELGLEISDEGGESVIPEQRWHELRARLTQLLERLDRREKLIIRARFSLGAHRKVQTLQALADRLGVSKERVRQLEKRALDKLRNMASEVRLAELDA